METIRIVIVDDHSVLRELLAERLALESSIEVVGSVGSAEEAISLVQRLRPDIVLTDIDMPGVNCFDAVRQMTAIDATTRFMFLSAYAHDHYIEQALFVGAVAYVQKGEPPAQIVKAIKSAAQGNTYFSPEVRKRMVDGQAGRGRAKGTTRASLLTNRELELVKYIARGLAKKEIARLMHVSLNTVSKHTSNVMEKLDIHDRVELAMFAIREGIAKP